MKKLPFIAFFAFQSLFAQEFAVNQFRGVVLNAKSKQPVPFAHFTYSNSKGFTSNEKGTFYVADLKEKHRSESQLHWV